MKKTLSALLLFALLIPGLAVKSNAQDNLSGKISLSGAFALYPLAVTWGQEFKKLHPNVTFDIQAGGAGKGMTDALSGTVDIGMVSRSISPDEKAKGAYPYAVAKDAVVPTINAKNPFLSEIIKKGITVAQLNKIYVTGEITTWDQITGNPKDNKPISIFSRSDAGGAGDTWAKLFGKKQEDLKGVGVYGDPGVAQAVAKDIYALGYNNIGFAYDYKTKTYSAGLRIAPIDWNKNGEIDQWEYYYDKMSQLDAAIIDGQFPSPPARNLYLVTNGKPTSPLVKAFLRYVLTDGQLLVAPNGYVKLPTLQVSPEIKDVTSK